MIKIAMNGGRTKADSPSIPITLDEYIEEMEWFKEQGISHFHIHFRDAGGRESLEQSAVEPQFRQLKERFPQCRIGIGTPLQNGLTAERRKCLIEAWDWSPDFLSLNLSEDGSLELVPVLRKKLVPIEYGVFSMQDALLFEKNYLEEYVCRVLIETVFATSPQNAVEDARAIGAFFQEHYPSIELLFHSENTATWAVIDYAKSRGLNWRIGLEDTLTLPDGRPAASNRELYLAAIGGKEIQLL